MKNKNRFLIGCVVGIIIGSVTLVCANQAIQAIQNTEIKVSLNGQLQDFKDETTGEKQYPITYNNRTYLPLRNIAELMKLNVDYDGSTNTAILKENDKNYIDLVKEIIKMQNGLDIFQSIKKFKLEGSNDVWYSLYTKEHSMVFDKEGNKVDCLEDGYIIGRTDLYIPEKGNPYYYVDDEDGRIMKYSLKFKNGKVISYKEKTESKEDNNEKPTSTTQKPATDTEKQKKDEKKPETMYETITRYVKEYNKANPDYMISEVYWSYSDYIRYLKDGIFVNVYYKDGKIKVEVTENTYVDTKDGVRKDLTKRSATNYKDFIYNLAKVGNENLSKEKVDQIYEDLENGKYGSQSLSNTIEFDDVKFTYWNQLTYFSTTIELDYEAK